MSSHSEEVCTGRTNKPAITYKMQKPSYSEAVTRLSGPSSTVTNTGWLAKLTEVIHRAASQKESNTMLACLGLFEVTACSLSSLTLTFLLSCEMQFRTAFLCLNTFWHAYVNRKPAEQKSDWAPTLNKADIVHATIPALVPHSFRHMRVLE